MWILCTVFRLLVIECLLHYVKPFMAIICSFQQVSDQVIDTWGVSAFWLL